MPPDIERMKYFRACLKESFRLTPSINENLRVNLKDLNLNDLNLKDLNLKDLIPKDLIPKDLNLKDRNLKDRNLKDLNLKDLNLKDLIPKDLNLKGFNLPSGTMLVWNNMLMGNNPDLFMDSGDFLILIYLNHLNIFKL